MASYANTGANQGETVNKHRNHLAVRRVRRRMHQPNLLVPVWHWAHDEHQTAIGVEDMEDGFDGCYCVASIAEAIEQCRLLGRDMDHRPRWTLRVVMVELAKMLRGISQAYSEGQGTICGTPWAVCTVDLGGAIEPGDAWAILLEREQAKMREAARQAIRDYRHLLGEQS